MRFTTEQKIQPNFSVSSLTDIVMLLLIFFLLSSSFVMQPGIKVQLPRAESGETQSENNITVSLTEKGQIFVNARQVTIESLGRELMAAMKGDPGKVVVVNADRNVTLQNTVQVIDVAKAVGATRFMIATMPLSAQ
jgi:biopolymer transport protein ExbD